MSIIDRLFPPSKKDKIDPVEKELIKTVQEGLVKSSPLEFKEVRVDEGISFTKKVSSLFNPKAISNFAVKSVGFLTSQVYRREIFSRPEYNLEEIRDASESDSYIKISFSKYSYLIFKAGWTFKSDNQEAIDYLNKRFKLMSYCTGKPMDILLQEIADDFTRYSNVILLKSRVDSIPGVKATPFDSDQVVGGYCRVDPASVKIKRDKYGNVIKYEQGHGANKKQFFPRDVIHMYYDKDANNAFGTPRIIAALDDVKLLRKIEGNIVALIHRFSMPLYQWKIGIPEVGFQGTDAEINRAKREVESSSLDGLIITNEKTEIKAIGAEGHALNAEPYLRYFEDRVFSALGVSASQMGRGGAKQDADSMEAQIHDTVKFIQRTISTWIKETVITELLLEGGFNPFDGSADVEFAFEEISLETKLKKENHEMLKYQSNVTTFEEARRKMGMKDTVEDEDRLYQRMIADKSSLDQIDRNGEWQERLAKINAAKTAANNNSSSSSSNSSSKSSVSTSKSKTRNTSGQKQPNKAATNNNRPQNQHGTSSVKVKELSDLVLDFVLDLQEDSISNETVINLYENTIYDYFIRELNRISLRAINEATIEINSVDESYHLLPNKKIDISSQNKELQKNIRTILEDMNDSSSNNKDDISSLSNYCTYRLKLLLEQHTKTTYDFSYIKAGSLLGMKEVYIKQGNEIENIDINFVESLNDVEVFNNYTITYDKRGDNE
jgi:hypothetical protein|nr:MAG TPA: Portal protein [Caudoviricetes sp.]